MKKIIVLLLVSFFSSHIFTQNKPALLVIYGAPKKIPNVNWKDGFVAAINLLREKYDIQWSTPQDLKSGKINYKNYAAILVKTSWNHSVDRFVRNFIPSNKPTALLISGFTKPTSKEQFLYYNVIFYETHYYGKLIKHHPCAIHAFGINSDIMKPIPSTQKKYDYLMIADFKHKDKRHLKLLNKAGVKLAVGSVDGGGNNQIKEKLKKAGVTVLEGLSAEKLAVLYNESRIYYMPATVVGGGDRSVLEARSCDVTVEIEPDNPKLKELLDGPILNHYYYVQQLEKGIKVLLSKASS